MLNVKTIVLQTTYFTSNNEEAIVQRSLPLPISDQTKLEKIFGLPQEFFIKTLDEDTAYKRQLENCAAMFSEYFGKILVKTNENMNNPSSFILSYKKI